MVVTGVDGGDNVTMAGEVMVLWPVPRWKMVQGMSLITLSLFDHRQLV
jgi:hypothetical protein